MRSVKCKNCGKEISILITVLILIILFLLFVGFLPAFVYCKINNAPQCTFALDPITCVQVAKQGTSND